MILTGCVAFAQHVGPQRVETELLPQCWEQVREIFAFVWGKAKALMAVPDRKHLLHDPSLILPCLLERCPGILMPCCVLLADHAQVCGETVIGGRGMRRPGTLPPCKRSADNVSF